MLTEPAYKRLVDAILNAFTRRDLEMLVAFNMDIRLDAVTPAAPFPVVVFELIDWAQKTGRLNELLQSLIKWRKHNQELVQILTEIYDEHLAPGNALIQSSLPPLHHLHEKRHKIFISYSHRDKIWLERLRVHLHPLELDYDLDFWSDQMIQAGSDWRTAITRALDEAKVAILVITADFIASDFIRENELPVLLKKAQIGGAVILPLIFGPSRFNLIQSLSRFQAVNDPSKPLAEMQKPKREKIFVKLTADVEKALTAPIRAPG